MKKIFTLASLLVCFNFYGQVGFGYNVVIDQYYGDIEQNGVVAADFDNDGKVDIAQAGGKRLMWFKNLDGQGKFSTGKNIISYTSIKKVLAADIDADGFKDIVYSRYTASSNVCDIYWVKNNGNGTFGTGVPIANAIPGTDARFQVVDVDGDGKLDVASIKANLQWHKNNGQGIFTLQLNELESAPAAFLFADLTGDGKADMITNSLNAIKIYKNNSNGIFILLETAEANAQTTGMMAAADVDGDTDNDLLLYYSNDITRNIRWYKNTNSALADGTVLINLPNSNVVSDKGMIAPADIDGDGKTDLLVSTPEANKVAWYKNLGNAAFGTEQIISLSIPNVVDMSTGDINGDERADVIVASATANKVAWFKNIPSGFAPEEVIGRSANYITYVEAGDLDGDGDKDLVSASTFHNQLAWYKNSDGQGDFSGEQQIVISGTLSSVRDVKLIDFDNDGDLDIITASYYFNDTGVYTMCIVFKNNGQGIFTQETIVPAEAGNIKYFYADADNDGDIDVFSLVLTSIRLYKNDGTGILSTPVSATQGHTHAPVKLSFSDMDGDSDHDMLIAYTNDQLVWRQNDGQGYFSSQTQKTISQTGGGSTYQAIADLDGDGDNDVLFRGTLTKIAWAKNDGSGNFTAVNIDLGNYNNIGICVHDIDSDGHKDIILTSGFDYRIAWIKNNGQQVFSAVKEVSSIAERALSIGVADFNADGKMDIYTASVVDDSVTWFKNMGEFSNIINGSVKVDVDGNGCTDTDAAVPQVLVTTQIGSSTWSTYTNINGGYSAPASQGTFTTSITSNLPGFNANPISQQSVFASNNGSANIANFCLQSQQAVTDLEVSVFRFADVRPGFSARYKVVVKNTGTVQVAGSVTVNFDNAKLNFNSVTPSATSQTGNMMTFDLGNMLPFAVKEFTLNFTAKTIPTLSLGDEVVFSANASVAGDATPANNQTTNTAIVVGSYDPNDIAVREGSQILLEDADEYLHYLIRFQNTGNYYAERVVVKNPIDSKLDWTTMQIESMSHNGRVEIINGAEATFTFDAIYLPAVTVNEPASHGYIAYRIKPKANVQLGDTFTEQAHIFFDFNPAIDTNIVTTTVVDAVAGLPQFTAETVSVYPVPSKNILNIKANTAIATIEIYNQAGQRVLSNALQNSIDISALSQGIYFAKIEDVNGSSVTKKVVKN